VLLSLTLDAEELVAITGYKRSKHQLAELHRRGFWRARITNGRLILERAHYEAVCQARFGAAAPADEPKVRQVVWPRRGRAKRG
jgi:hypothetical protein